MRDFARNVVELRAEADAKHVAVEKIGKDAEEALPDLRYLQEKDCTNHVRESAQMAVLVIRAAALGPSMK